MFIPTTISYLCSPLQLISWKGFSTLAVFISLLFLPFTPIPVSHSPLITMVKSQTVLPSLQKCLLFRINIDSLLPFFISKHLYFHGGHPASAPISPSHFAGFTRLLCRSPSGGRPLFTHSLWLQAAQYVFLLKKKGRLYD